jgi:hypothetical protein
VKATGSSGDITNNQFVLIRPMWAGDEGLPHDLSPEAEKLNKCQQSIIQGMDCCFNLFLTTFEEDAESVRPLLNNAKTDLIAGCELARLGYIKPAYTVWRSWFEQSLFLLYFLEAPIHRLGWKVFQEVALGDDPRYRLMLHQLLANSSEKHPFVFVYEDRFTKLLTTLGISTLPKEKKITNQATRILTIFSQGVHGTFQPLAPSSEQVGMELLDRHCNKPLELAGKVILLYYSLLCIDRLGLPDGLIVAMREKVADLQIYSDFLVENIPLVSDFSTHFAFALGSING